MLGFERHDHARCVGGLLSSAERSCREQGLRLTPVRRRVLEILLEEHRAIGAYDILARLAGEGHAAQPPIAYRALDFLVGHGFAHKIERLNAYIACTHPGDRHAPAFLICRNCDRVAETLAQAETVTRTARRAGFAVERTVIEAEGLCADCRAAPESDG
jgi:Fur family transcriptional regulator, zinc uptake regulator